MTAQLSTSETASTHTFVPLQCIGAKRRSSPKDTRPKHKVNLLESIARGFYWSSLIESGEMAGGIDIGDAEGLHPTTVNEAIRLTLLAPDIIEMLMFGTQPPRMNLFWFQHHKLPADWDLQRQLVESFWGRNEI